MDPNACWDDIVQAHDDLRAELRDGDSNDDEHDAAVALSESLANLRGWLDMGGFGPAIFEAQLGRANITPQDAAYVLHILHDDTIGYAPGNFYRDLIGTCCLADDGNLALIARGFPGIAAAVKTYKLDMDGVAWLKLRAQQ